jgi:hypothetical protein
MIGKTDTGITINSEKALNNDNDILVASDEQFKMTVYVQVHQATITTRMQRSHFIRK